MPALALAPAAGEVCLDLCAAPGNKSMQLLEALGAQGAVLLGRPSWTWGFYGLIYVNNTCEY